MPFISRLKKLGELPVPELQTTLTVYLIHLEHSEETNLVYTSSNPIPADAAPPANLRFDSPEGYTKRGDVLIWASRVHKKACYVHACWVFEGHGWAKPSSDSEIMMDHPVHPDYQLVVLSGPYIKWELKPDPDREPSLTLPDPPPLRPGARGSMNTIFLSFSSSSSSLPPQQHAENTAHAERRRYRRPGSSDLASDTPDGSAAMCSSSRFSTPLSDIPEDQKPAVAPPGVPSESTIQPMDVPKMLRSSFSLPSSTPIGPAQTDRVISSDIRAIIPEKSRSVSAESTSRARAVERRRPKGTRSMPPGRGLTPNTGAPPTPESSMRTRARRLVRSDTVPEKSSKSSPLPRRRKRHRPIDDDHFVPAAFRTLASGSNAGSPPPAKRRRLGTSNLVLKLPFREIESTPREDEDDNDCESPTDPDSFWYQLEELQREKDTLASQVQEAANLHTRLAREAKERDRVVLELRRQLAAAQLPNSAATSSETDPAEQQGKDAMYIQRLDVETRRLRDDLEAATCRIRELEAEKGVMVASPTCMRPEDLTQLRTERDEACQVAVEIKAELEQMRQQRDAALIAAHDSKRAANDIAVARANDVTVSFRSIRELTDQKMQLERDLIQSKRDLEMRLATFRSEGAKTPHETNLQGPSRPRQPVKLEDELEDQRRRAASFEASLRVAQEALQRQRTHAQETEVLQRRTISQLAKELQEKEQSAKEIGHHVENLERQVSELQKSFLAGDNALKLEREEGWRIKDEIKRIKEATQADRLQMAGLQAKVAADRIEIVGAEDKIRECEALIERMRQEKHACDVALADEVRLRTDCEAQLLEYERSKIALEQLHRKAEQGLRQERTAKLASQSELEAQRIVFRDHLSLSDRERGRLEELLLERRSSLQLELKSKTQDLVSAQAESAKLKAERSADRDQFTVDLAACTQRQVETTRVCESMEVEIKKYRAEKAFISEVLSEARLDFAASMTKVTLERNVLVRELSEAREKLEKVLSTSEIERAEGLQHQRRIEEELSALQREFRSRGQALESTKADCVQLEADISSERQQLTSQLSLMNSRLEEQRTASQEELDNIRAKHKSAEQALQKRCASIDRKACRTAGLLKLSQEEAAKSQALLQTDREHSEAELSSAREKLSSVDSLLATANREKSNIERLLAEERSLKAQLSSESTSYLRELEGVRADLLAITSDLASTRHLLQDAASSREVLQKELSTCQSTLILTKEGGKREQERLRVELRSMATGLEESKTECSRLKAETASQRTELSPDNLRSKLSSVEARLELEKTTTLKLRKQLLVAKEYSDYWPDLGSRLLRSLHIVQDQLKAEQITSSTLRDELALERLKMQALQDELALERSKVQSVGVYDPQQNNA